MEEQVSVEPDAEKKYLSSAALQKPFAALVDTFAGLDRFDPQSLETALRTTADLAGIKAGALIHATRVAVTGRAVSPGLFEVLELLGQQRTVARMRAAKRLIPT